MLVGSGRPPAEVVDEVVVSTGPTEPCLGEGPLWLPIEVDGPCGGSTSFIELAPATLVVFRLSRNVTCRGSRERRSRAHEQEVPSRSENNDA
jgi:hypothetical protein